MTLVVLLLVLAAGVGVLWGRSGQSAHLTVGRTSAVAAESPRTPAAWASVLDSLDARRSAAFARGDPAALQQVYVADSVALRRDTTRLATLTAQHERASGVRHRVRSVRVLAQTDGRAVLAVRDTMTAYEVLDADGQVVQRTAARGALSIRMRLTRQGSGWLITSLSSV